MDSSVSKGSGSEECELLFELLTSGGSYGRYYMMQAYDADLPKTHLLCCHRDTYPRPLSYNQDLACGIPLQESHLLETSAPSPLLLRQILTLMSCGIPLREM